MLCWKPDRKNGNTPILTFFDDHWEQALRYLRKKGMGKHRRGSNSESGMRLLRRLEKNHDGIRSATTRQHYIQIYQAMKYLSLDIADFLDYVDNNSTPTIASNLLQENTFLSL